VTLSSSSCVWLFLPRLRTVQRSQQEYTSSGSAAARRRRRGFDGNRDDCILSPGRTGSLRGCGLALRCHLYRRASRSSETLPASRPRPQPHKSGVPVPRNGNPCNVLPGTICSGTLCQGGISHVELAARKCACRPWSDRGRNPASSDGATSLPFVGRSRYPAVRRPRFSFAAIHPSVRYLSSPRELGSAVSAAGRCRNRDRTVAILIQLLPLNSKFLSAAAGAEYHPEPLSIETAAAKHTRSAPNRAGSARGSPRQMLESNSLKARASDRKTG